ncbi:hypothetical protein AGMMS49975_14910 [Clostridia bacterium]|nr:hypothetical protein AGMMS49975_14910 [Clostridia bacterium]
MTGKDVVAPFAYKVATDADLFEGWLENIFAPCVRDISRSVLIIDNASFHNKERIFDIADEYGFKVIFLPPYSPDLNPIEKLWANVKRRLRFHMHKFDSFWDALANAFK